jgi:hypothetical protein
LNALGISLRTEEKSHPQRVQRSVARVDVDAIVAAARKPRQ